jgi:uncharacterized protein (TIGR02231 family)
MSTTLNAPVVSVTVSEDRAHVVRRGEAQLGAGLTRLVVEDVAPVLVDKTLKVAVDGGVTVVEARVERQRLHTEAERREDVAALDAEIDEKTQKERDLARARKRREMDLSSTDALIAHLLADLATDASWGQADLATLRSRLQDLEDEEKTKRHEFLLMAEEQRRLGEDLARLKTRRAAHSDVATRARARVHVTLSAPAETRAKVSIDYVVPGACWRPQHTARAVGQKLHFATDGCVWQNTGEAWSDVEILLSTERPSLGQEPPQIADDWISTQKKQEQLVVEARQQEIQTAGLGGAAAPRKEITGLPGIDDGGEARVLRGAAKSSVPSDGRPHRVPLFAFDTDAKIEIVMYPALAPLAIRKSTQMNAASQPILAGPVDLVEESGYVGRTQVLFIAPGERFELGWGPDPGVRARRTIEEVEEEPGVLTSWITRSIRVNVHVSSLDERARTIAVTEAIPVSEIEKVQITLDPKETSDAAKQDDDGFVKWNVKLGGFGRAYLKMRYVIKRHKEVVGL